MDDQGLDPVTGRMIKYSGTSNWARAPPEFSTVPPQAGEMYNGTSTWTNTPSSAEFLFTGTFVTAYCLLTRSAPLTGSSGPLATLATNTSFFINGTWLKTYTWNVLDSSDWEYAYNISFFSWGFQAQGLHNLTIVNPSASSATFLDSIIYVYDNELPNAPLGKKQRLHALSEGGVAGVVVGVVIAAVGGIGLGFYCWRRHWHQSWEISQPISYYDGRKDESHRLS